MRKNDLLLALVVIFLGAALILFRQFNSLQGSLAIAYEDSKPVMEIPMDREGTYRIETFNDAAGAGYNSVTVREGRLFVDSADCPDGLCIRQGAIAREGETIICLPHRLAIKVERGLKGDVDAVPGR